MNEPAQTLTLDQELQVKIFTTKVEQMDERETKAELVALYGYMIIRQRQFQQQLGAQWGMTDAT